MQYRSSIKYLIPIKTLQKYLKKFMRELPSKDEEYRYNIGRVDGIVGRRTKTAMRLRVLHASRIYGEGTLLPDFKVLWSKSVTLDDVIDDGRGPSQARYMGACQQLFLYDVTGQPLTIDGFFGPETQAIFDLWQELLRSNLEEYIEELESTDLDVAPVDWPRYRDIEKFYGKPGENLKLYTLPYNMVLAWDTSTTIRRITLNKKCGESAIGVLEAVRDHYGSLEEISSLGLDLFAGSFNNRSMRGGNRKSTHAYGCAIDFDSARNPLRATSATAEFAKDVYLPWWSLWESAGWVSLGRERNYDWMHVQACLL